MGDGRRKKRISGRKTIRLALGDKITHGRGLSVFFSSKIAIALTLFALVMLIGITGFMIFTTHGTKILHSIYSERLEELNNTEELTVAERTEKIDIEIKLEEDTFVGHLFLSGYMTGITITTVGYDDVVRNYLYDSLNENWRRAYNIWITFFVIAAYMVILFVNANFVAYLVGSKIAENMRRKTLLKTIRRLSGHFIICGFGRTGEVIAREFMHIGASVVAIDLKDSMLSGIKNNSTFHFLDNCDCLQEKTLLDAGIEKARGIVSLLPDDSSNLYLTLTARFSIVTFRLSAVLPVHRV